MIYNNLCQQALIISITNVRGEFIQVNNTFKVCSLVQHQLGLLTKLSSKQIVSFVQKEVKGVQIKTWV